MVTRVTAYIGRALADGYSIRQIAEHLNAHEDTVRALIVEAGLDVPKPVDPCSQALCGEQPRAGRYPAGFVTVRRDPDVAFKFCGWACAARFITMQAS